MVSSYLEATDAELAPLLPKSNCSRSQPTPSLADQVSSLLAEVLPASLCNALGQAMLVIPLFAAARIGETELVVTCAASAISIFLLHPLIEMIAVRAVVHQGSFVKTCELSFFLALLTGCSFYSGPIFAFFLQDSHLADLVGTYYKLFTPAIPAFALFIYLRSHAAVQGSSAQELPNLCLSLLAQLYITSQLVWTLADGSQFLGVPLASAGGVVVLALLLLNSTTEYGWFGSETSPRMASGAIQIPALSEVLLEAPALAVCLIGAFTRGRSCFVVQFLLSVFVDTLYTVLSPLSLAVKRRYHFLVNKGAFKKARQLVYCGSAIAAALNCCMFGLLRLLKEVEGLRLSESRITPGIVYLFVFATVEALTSPVQSILLGHERVVMVSSALFYVIGCAPILLPAYCTSLGLSLPWMAAATITAALHCTVLFWIFVHSSHQPDGTQPTWYSGPRVTLQERVKA